ncbi:MAG: response regulator transcription factor [Saprospiraceae bacterium]
MDTNMNPRLLYVEDDESLRFVTQDNLEIAGYTVIGIADGAEAKKQIEEGLEFDIAILDIMLPGVDGFAVAEAIRERDAEVPVLFLSAKSLKEDRLHGLRIGADDYLTKPFNIEELVLKVDIFLRRRHLAERPPEELTVGRFAVDMANLELTDTVDKGEPRRLTQRELDLLALFARSPNRVLKRSDILIKIWGSDDYFLGRSMDVFISRLRKYLRADERVSIENVHGVGFRLNAPEE